MLTSRAAEEPETTVPVSHSALIDAGRAGLDVPPTILDALEEDLAMDTGASEVASSSPRVRVQIESRWRESNDNRTRMDSESEIASVAMETPVPEPLIDDSEEDVVHSESGDAERLTPRLVQEEVVAPRMGAITTAFRQLEMVDLSVEFARRGNVMKTVPGFFFGPFRNVLRVALEEATIGSVVEDLARQERGWKLFLLIPRLLLHRGPRGGLISHKLSQRFELFARGDWMALLRASQLCDEQAAVARRRSLRRAGDDIEKMGELSSARQALEGASIAPGTV